MGCRLFTMRQIEGWHPCGSSYLDSFPAEAVNHGGGDPGGTVTVTGHTLIGVDADRCRRRRARMVTGALRRSDR